MQTLTIRASKSKIKQILEFAQTLKIDFYLDENEKSVKLDELNKKIINYKNDIKAYNNGNLKTSPLGKGWKYL